MNVKKTLRASSFSFIVLNLVEKAILHYVGLYKSALRNKQLTISNADNPKGNTKNTSFQFLIVNLVNKSILHFLVTTGA